MTAQLRAGVARTNLNPPVGISHGNWGAQTHARAAGIDLDLVGTALVLANGDTQVAILDTEFCIATGELARPIREAVTALTGIPFDNVRLSYTHTHSGPSLGPTWLHEGDEMDAKRAHMAMQKAAQYAGMTEVQAELHGIRIGDIALVGFPGEPFAEIGVAVKQGSPFGHTLFSGYTNDYFGYLPIDAARPDGGYEVETTPFAPGSADAVIEASLALLRDLRA